MSAAVTERLANEELSLPAEVLLLSIEPGHGGLLAKRRRLRKSLRAAGRVSGTSGTLAAARRELVAFGLIELRGLSREPHLTDRVIVARRFNALKRAAADDALTDDRDQQVFVLLAGSGVLARRMVRSELRTARRRLSDLAPEPNSSVAGLTPGIAALTMLGAYGFGDADGGCGLYVGDGGFGGFGGHHGDGGGGDGGGDCGDGGGGDGGGQ